MPSHNSPIFIDEDRIRQLLHYESLIPVIRQALIDLSAGRVIQPLRTILSLPQAQEYFAVMPAVYGEIMGAKMVCVFPLNTQHSLPTHLATIQLFRSSTGEALATMDGRLITEMRTAAVSAIAVDLLASPDAQVLAILGSGVQARAHVEALRHVRDFQEIRVWSRNPTNAQRFAQEVGAKMMSAEQAVRGADIVITATNSPEPVLFGRWLHQGALVVAMGAVGPTVRELDDEAMNNSVVVECRESAHQESGDVILSKATVDAEIGEVLAGMKLPRRTRNTIFKSVGIAVEDLAAARMVYERASGLVQEASLHNQ